VTHGGPSFLVVEGTNGTGKTTVAAALTEWLGAVAFHFPPEFARFREEAGLDRGMAPTPRLAYYLAGTLHLSSLVDDELAAGRPVVCDRYAAAPLSALEADGALPPGELEAWMAMVRPHLRRPDLTLLLTAEHAVAAERIGWRAGADLTPIESRSVSSPEWYRRRAEALRRHAATTGPVAELDTSALDPEAASRAAWDLVVGALGSDGRHRPR